MRRFIRGCMNLRGMWYRESSMDNFWGGDSRMVRALDERVSGGRDEW